MIDGLVFIKDVSWDEVFRVWEENEGQDPVWQEFAKKEKGFENWRAWRAHQSAKIGAHEREWKLYEMVNPNATVPKFLMGPFRGWQNHYEEKNIHTFADLARDHTAWVANNVGVKARLAEFPEITQFIGIYAKDEDQIILVEGHHRAAAVALAAFQGNSIVFTKNHVIALTEMDTEEVKKLRELLNQK